MQRSANAANRVVALCVPLTPFTAATSLSIFIWIGWTATAVAVLAAISSWLLDKSRPTIHTILIGTIICSLILLGITSHGLPAQPAYLQIVQLLTFGIIVANYRKVLGGSYFDALTLVIVALMIAANFTISSTVELFESNRSWTSPIFENPNLMGFYFLILAIFSFMVSSAFSTQWMRSIAYAFCLLLVLFIAATGSRTSMLAMAVFLAAYAIGKAFSGSRALLSAGAVFTLVMVPVITLSYLIAVGARINLVPPPPLQSPSAKTSGPSCVPTPYLVCPPAKATRQFDMRAGGILGLNKRFRSGRDKIWPRVIELSGESPLWGHGLGTSPAGFLPQPSTGMHAHSGFLLVYYQFGLIGLALYFLFWCVLFSRAINVGDVNTRVTSVAILCMACILETIEIVLIQTHPGMGVALGILAVTEFTSRPNANTGQLL